MPRYLEILTYDFPPDRVLRSQWGTIAWREWCELEAIRINKDKRRHVFVQEWKSGELCLAERGLPWC